MTLELWDDDLDEHELFACCYGNKWYRVRAENVLQDSKVQVFMLQSSFHSFKNQLA